MSGSPPLYRREVDGLRAVAVLPVMLYHAGLPAFGGGFVGVDVFFVISGYLVTRLLLADNPRLALSDFYERRVRRILPALTVVLAVTTLVAWWWLLPRDLLAYSTSLLAVVGLVANIRLWHTASQYFAGPAERDPLLHTWSLSVEEQFYLLFPAVVAATRRLSARARLVLFAALAVASLSLAEHQSRADSLAAFFLLPARSWELLLGALLAVQLGDRPGGTGRRVLDETLSLLGLLLIGVATATFTGDLPYPGRYALVPTLGTALVIAAATPATLVGRLLAHRAAVAIGLVSYSAYLWHQPLLAMARHVEATPLSGVARLSLVALALALAALSWRCVEAPWRDRRRVSRRVVVTAAVVSTLVLAAAGVAGMATDGGTGRFSAADLTLATAESGAGAYVEARFDELQHAAFDPANPARKVVVIGDSFAQDFVNALFEAGFADHLQISTRHIAHYCGGLYLPPSQLAPHLTTRDYQRCDGTFLTPDGALIRRMREADEVWFAGLWQPWQAPLVAASVDALRAETGRPVKVFGIKDFGRYRIRRLLTRPVPERYAVRQPIEPYARAVNAVMRRTVPADTFVDVLMLFCGPDASTCPLFTPDGALVSYDGQHLTRAGALLYGERLAGHPLLAGYPRGPVRTAPVAAY